VDRVSVSVAASRLGVTPDAVRQRIRRGTIEYQKTEDGRYYVYLTPQDGRRDGVQNALVDRLVDENAFLRRELERKDAILLNMTEAMKSLEAPRDEREPPVTASEERGNGYDG
jgi:DNA-binding transcriptional MerR regulator